MQLWPRFLSLLHSRDSKVGLRRLPEPSFGVSEQRREKNTLNRRTKPLSPLESTRVSKIWTLRWHGVPVGWTLHAAPMPCLSKCVEVRDGARGSSGPGRGGTAKKSTRNQPTKPLCPLESVTVSKIWTLIGVHMEECVGRAEMAGAALRPRQMIVGYPGRSAERVSYALQTHRAGLGESSLGRSLERPRRRAIDIGRNRSQTVHLADGPAGPRAASAAHGGPARKGGR